MKTNTNTNTGELLTVYVAGKVSGLPYKEVVEKFKSAGCKLSFSGYLPILPIEYCNANWGWWRSMRVCLSLLKDCDCIAILHDWKQSKGARIEYLFAQIWRKKIIKL